MQHLDHFTVLSAIMWAQEKITDHDLESVGVKGARRKLRGNLICFAGLVKTFPISQHHAWFEGVRTSTTYWGYLV